MERSLQGWERQLGQRIYQFILMSEKDSVYDFSENSPYTESILSLELKKYFSELVMENNGENGTEKAASLLQQIFTELQLDTFEQMCVALAVIGEINPYFEKFFIYMNNDWNHGYLTPDTAIKLYSLGRDSNVDFYQYFLQGSKLLQYFFNLYGQEGKGMVRWGLKCRRYFFQFLFTDISDSFADVSFVKWCDVQEKQEMLFLNSSVYSKLDNIVGQDLSGIFLSGMENSGKTQMVVQYSRKCGRSMCLLDIRRLVYVLDKNLLEGTLEEFCYDIQLQLMVRKAWICLYSIGTEFWDKESNRQVLATLIELLQAKDSVLFITGEQAVNLSKYYAGIFEISLGVEDLEGNLQTWETCSECYSLAEDIQLNFFSITYHFTPVQIKRIFENAEKQRILKNAFKISREDIKESCVRETSSNGGHMITVMDTGYRWDDLVLPAQQKEQLRTACNRVLYRGQIYDAWGFGQKVAYGRGVSMVFSGPPGTGKTMSAGIVADYLGTTLYRVDLAAVVSKYIGETEKNLNTIFETVKRGCGVLFFDEADVLFSKRTEVSNSNDKHSNMEAAYLLQKMEEYEGVVILATNYIQNMDEAFKRRIQFLIDFPLPDIECRKWLWKKVFPKQILFEEEPDYDFLARQFELTGSHIKNIALQAAFFAADEKKGVSMKHIIKALLLEIKKTGKTISREELREYYIYYE